MTSSRCKIRTTEQLKPGMVVRSHHALAGSLLDPYREVASVTKYSRAERIIRFTDGTAVRWSNGSDFQVARSKAIRNAAKARAAIIPTHALADAFAALLGAYARQAVTA